MTLGRCRWYRCTDEAREIFTVGALGYLWNGNTLYAGDTIALCMHHSVRLRDHTYEHELPHGCGPIPGSLHRPFAATARRPEPPPRPAPKPKPEPRRYLPRTSPRLDPPSTIEVSDYIGDYRPEEGEVLSVRGAGTANGRYRITRVAPDGTVHGVRISLAP